MEIDFSKPLPTALLALINTTRLQLACQSSVSNCSGVSRRAGDSELKAILPVLCYRSCTSGCTELKEKHFVKPKQWKLVKHITPLRQHSDYPSNHAIGNMK